MRFSPRLLQTLLGLSCLVPALALGCGESLFRVGKGVHYRAYSAPLPGTVLIYARSEAERAMAEQLRRAGHQVLIVTSDRDLASEAASGHVDVVIAPAGMRDTVTAKSVTEFGAPGWVPVYESAAEQRSAASGRNRGVVRDEDARHYLKAIHTQLKHPER